MSTIASVNALLVLGMGLLVGALISVFIFISGVVSEKYSRDSLLISLIIRLLVFVPPSLFVGWLVGELFSSLIRANVLLYVIGFFLGLSGLPFALSKLLRR
jgi:hypothetical protein